MKKIYKSLLFAMVAALAMPFLASCEDDNGSNPTLTYPDSFVLNTPEFAANNVYDLPSSEYVNLTTNQPNYGGWPAGVTYMVQISLDQTDEEGWKELAAPYTSTKINVPAAELNAAILDMYRAAHEDADPEGEMPLYVRMRAYLADSGDHFGEVFSNVVTLNVLSYDTPSDVSLPTELYVCGNSIDDSWKTWKPLAPVYGREGRFYTMVYNAGDGFKWGTKPDEWLGYDMINEFDDQAGAGISGASDGNIVFANAGWYVLKFVAKVVGSEVQYKLIVAPGVAGVVGNAVDNGSWSSQQMTAPARKGEFTYRGFTGTGELRAFIQVPDEDWWRTEFTLYNGELYWRTVDIPNDWATNVGEDYSVTVNSSSILKINFDNNTGSVE